MEREKIIRDRLEKTKEKADLNISVLKALIDAGIVDGTFVGEGAQEVVDKIEELAEAILKINK